MRVKSSLDRAAAGILLLAFLPLLLLVACAIKLEGPGPIFFCQPRYGRNRKLFKIIKFRTMHHAMQDTLADQQTRREDPRVTRVGKWLRKLSIDELPQLVNVLRGEMSLVGPRPHAPNTNVNGLLLEATIPEYSERYEVRPGITGLAQISGCRGALNSVEQVRERVGHDLDYIRNWSLSLDFSIVLRTIRHEIISHDAC